MLQLSKRCRVPMRHVYVATEDYVVLAVREGTRSAEQAAERLSRSRREKLSVWACDTRLHPGQFVPVKDAVFCGTARFH